MSETFEVRLPDIGTDEHVEVVEVLVSGGTTVAIDDPLITLESDKASMDLPAPRAGVVRSVAVSVGAKVKQGDLVCTLEATESGAAKASDDSGDAQPPTAAAETTARPSPTVAPAMAAPAGGADVLVLGSGPGGYTAAFRAADLGLDVVLVERYPTLGGVCLNVGCIPSKALLHTAKVIDEAAFFADHGVVFGKPAVDLDKLRGWKDKVVGRLVGGIATMAKGRGVTVIQGTGRFTGPHELTVETAEGEREVGFRHAIIAAGSQAIRLPFLPDDPRIMDSTGALELADIPERLLVVGGGIIGLEMADVYHALGSRITVVELTDGLMPGTDRDLVRRYQRSAASSFENIYLSTKLTAVEATDDGLVAHFEGDNAPATDTFDRLLESVGRRPNGKRIGAEAAGVMVDEGGFIATDRQMRTNVPHIFAIGDIAGHPMLAHKASHEGKVAAEVIAGEKSAFDARVIPSIAYTDPEIAWVGLTETEAKAEGIAYEKGLFPWSANARSLTLGRDDGMTKLLFDAETHRIVGAGLVGPHAGDLIAETALAIEMGCDAADIGLTIHPHPTLSETIGMAAEVFEGTVTDIPLPRRKSKN